MGAVYLTGSSQMASDDEWMRYAREYVRLAALTDLQPVREQLIEHARGCVAAALQERRSDDARVLTLASPRS